MADAPKKMLKVYIARDANGKPIPKAQPKPPAFFPINPAQLATTKGSNLKTSASHPDMNFDGGLDTFGLPPHIA